MKSLEVRSPQRAALRRPESTGRPAAARRPGAPEADPAALDAPASRLARRVLGTLLLAGTVGLASCHALVVAVFG